MLSTALNYAVELDLITANPLAGIRMPPARTIVAVDRRSVVNPDQARRLLGAVRVRPPSGDRLLAFFGCLYYAALRPEEAANLRMGNLELPDSGWGWITMDGAAPEVDAQWSDSGVRGGLISGVVYRRTWQRARQAALAPEQVDSPLAARPYDLRHAAVSTWLNGGVAPTQVADWAGHSVAVLLKVYAKCLDGETEASLRKIEASLR